jgi:extracellular factor (EF) 3-hydroxypalmitic acid methyl ester biosynthesis protein
MNSPGFPTGTGDRETLISCRNSQGAEIRATPVRLTRYTVVLEVYNPFSILQLSEVLSEFRIRIGERLAYDGRAVVSNIVNAGIMVLCEATLEESWLEIDLFSPISQPDRLRTEFTEFMAEWAKIRAVLPDFKVAVADFQTLLLDLRRWLDQVELGVRSEAAGSRADMERSVLVELETRMLPEIDGWMSHFDQVANSVAEEARPAHRAYARRQLHPLVLCSPFVYRTYQKPLGYAGDYEMVNMILRDPHEGATMFAKLVNVSFLQNPPAAAHRNRILFLKKCLADETRRLMAQGRRIQVFNLGCGPAREVRDFLAEDNAADQADFHLFDFNPQTLDYTRATLAETRTRHGRQTGIHLAERSINHLLKEAGKVSTTTPARQYDLVYCAGLFDYVSDRVCKRLNELFYHLLAPGGLMVVTNVDASKPFRHSMDYLLEWHLIYRDRASMERLVPSGVPAGCSRVSADPTGVNLFLEIRKPAVP